MKKISKKVFIIIISLIVILTILGITIKLQEKNNNEEKFSEVQKDYEQESEKKENVQNPSNSTEEENKIEIVEEPKDDINNENKNINQVTNTNNSKEIEQETKNKSDQKVFQDKKEDSSNNIDVQPNEVEKRDETSSDNVNNQTD